LPSPLITLLAQVWYTHPVFSVALGGVLPFGAVCIELFFIMSALWLHQVGQDSTMDAHTAHWDTILFPIAPFPLALIPLPRN